MFILVLIGSWTQGGAVLGSLTAAKKGPKPVTTDRLVLEGESENAGRLEVLLFMIFIYCFINFNTF